MNSKKQEVWCLNQNGIEYEIKIHATLGHLVAYEFTSKGMTVCSSDILWTTKHRMKEVLKNYQRKQL